MANGFYRMGVATLTGVDEPTLKQGSSGDWVTKLQMRLNASGAGGGQYLVDGNFGADTDQQLRLFQGAYGLKVDGIAGPETWSKLYEVTGTPTVAPSATAKPVAVPKRTLVMDPLVITAKAPKQDGLDWEPFAFGGLALLAGYGLWKALS
jgi:peptidoglycan hydrolase-like protein with peptidoglycan-binding domain